MTRRCSCESCSGATQKSRGVSLWERKLCRHDREFPMHRVSSRSFLPKPVCNSNDCETYLDSNERKRPGRPPMFSPPKIVLQEIHLRMSEEVWTALRKYRDFANESSLSQAARKLLRERLTELGFLNQRIQEDNSRRSSL